QELGFLRHAWNCTGPNMRTGARNPTLRHKVRHNFRRYLTSSPGIRRAEQSRQESPQEKSTRFRSSALLRATFSSTIQLLLEEWALPIEESDEGRMPLRSSLDSYAARALVTEPALFADLRLCCYRTP